MKRTVVFIAAVTLLAGACSSRLSCEEWVDERAALETRIDEAIGEALSIVDAFETGTAENGDLADAMLHIGDELTQTKDRWVVLGDAPDEMAETVRLEILALEIMVESWAMGSRAIRNGNPEQLAEAATNLDEAGTLRAAADAAVGSCD